MKHHRRRGVRIEMTSLMDVMFLVLVFFIYAIFDMTTHKGIKIDLPGANGVDERGERVIITITKDNLFQVDGESRLAIDAVVSDVAAKSDEKPVLISGDKNADLGVALELLSALKNAGIKKVSFQVSGKSVTDNTL